MEERLRKAEENINSLKRRNKLNSIALLILAISLLMNSIYDVL